LRQFSDQYLAALTVMVVGIAAVIWAGRRGGERVNQAVTYTLAALVLLGWVGEYIDDAVLVITGGNYMYMRAKPVHNSLLSVMGPWPWYIAAGIGVGLAMLLLVAVLTELFRGQPVRRILPATHRLSQNPVRGLYSHAQDQWLTPKRDPRA
jgi:uncharacterized membrane protein YwaF